MTATVAPEKDVARHAAEERPLHAAQAARPGDDQVAASTASSLDDLVCRVTLRHAGRRRDVVIHEPPRQLVREAAVPVEELLALLGEVVRPQGVDVSEQLERALRKW